MTGNLLRNPDIQWRAEPHREDHVREVLGDPGRTAEDEEITGVGTVTLLDSGFMHQLNLLAGEIWKLCDGSMDRDTVVRCLEEMFDVDPAELKADVDSFLDEMIDKGMIYESK